MKNFKQGLRLFCSRCNIAKAVLYTFAIITAVIVSITLLDGGLNPQDDIYMAYISILIYHFTITFSAINNGLFNHISVRTSPYAKSCLTSSGPVFFAVSSLAAALIYVAAELIFRHSSVEQLVSDFATIIFISSILSLLCILNLNGIIAIAPVLALSGFVLTEALELIHRLSIPAALTVSVLTAAVCLAGAYLYLRKIYGTKRCTNSSNYVLEQNSSKEKQANPFIIGNSREVKTSRINAVNDYSLLTYSEPLALWKTIVLSVAAGAFIWAECFFNFGAPVPEILIFIIAITNMSCLSNILKVSRSALTMKNRQKTDNFMITIPRIAERSVPVYLMLILYNVLTVFLAPAVGTILCRLSGTEPSRDIWSLFICIFTGLSILPITSAIKTEGKGVCTMFAWCGPLIAMRLVVADVTGTAFIDTVLLVTGIVISVVCFASHAFKVSVTVKRKALNN